MYKVIYLVKDKILPHVNCPFRLKQYESMKYQPKLSYSKGIESKLCIIKHMP